MVPESQGQIPSKREELGHHPGILGVAGDGGDPAAAADPDKPLSRARSRGSPERRVHPVGAVGIAVPELHRLLALAPPALRPDDDAQLPGLRPAHPLSPPVGAPSPLEPRQFVRAQAQVAPLRLLRHAREHVIIFF